MDELMLRRARSFGAVATVYARVRPGYPPDAISWLLEGLQAPGTTGIAAALRPVGSPAPAGGRRGTSAATGLPRPRPAHDSPREPPPRWRVLDLGAGTGALTRTLVSRGFDVVAVEPDPEMRAVLAEQVPGADVRAGSAEDLPVGDAEVDAVLGAQMWHWVRLEQAVTEVARVLRRGGSFGLLWNLRDERVRWIGALGRILGGEDTHSGAAHVMLPAGSPFTATAARDFLWWHELAPRDVVDLVATRSHVQVQSESERTALLSRVAELVATHPDIAGKTRVVVRYVCSCWRATRM